MPVFSILSLLFYILFFILTIGGYIYMLYGLSRHLKLSRERNEILKEMLKASTKDTSPQL